jgi:GntR family transcriptional regulator, rspAB operon transcriptional repressor
MTQQIEFTERRTSTDGVFDYLRGLIVSNILLPGTKISESEIASLLGVSRQPVRDAFNRLANVDLLLIRPQKATEVRGFSLSRIAEARFVRMAVELEVVRRACEVWNDACAKRLETSLTRQRQAIALGDVEAFHACDYEFHKLICDLSNNAFVFGTIQNHKVRVDRLCMLSLRKASEAADLLEDHQELADALLARDVRDAERILRRHLARLDETIQEVHERHTEFFEG